jgi:Myb-like DNA-binding domain
VGLVVVLRLIHYPHLISLFFFFVTSHSQITQSRRFIHLEKSKKKKEKKIVANFWLVMSTNRSTPAIKRNLQPAPVASGPHELLAVQNPLQAIALQTGLSSTDPMLSSGQGGSASASPSNPKKRKASVQPLAPAPQPTPSAPMLPTVPPSTVAPTQFGDVPPTAPESAEQANLDPAADSRPAKRGRTNTPWTAEEEHRLKQMRDQGKSWSEIAKTFPNRTEGSVKKHWYKVRVISGLAYSTESAC